MRETTQFDAGKYNDTEEATEAFLSAALESGDTGHIIHALSIVARARKMPDLERSLAGRGDMPLDEFLAALAAVGQTLRASAHR